MLQINVVDTFETNKASGFLCKVHIEIDSASIDHGARVKYKCFVR